MLFGLPGDPRPRPPKTDAGRDARAYWGVRNRLVGFRRIVPLAFATGTYASYEDAEDAELREALYRIAIFARPSSA